MKLRRLLRSPSGSFPHPLDLPSPAGCGALGFRFYSRGLRGPYEELGLSEGATPAEVKQAYHRRSLEWSVKICPFRPFPFFCFSFSRFVLGFSRMRYEDMFLFGQFPTREVNYLIFSRSIVHFSLASELRV